MPVVQATLSFVVELGEFHNVDLYHRGFYQIRTHFKTNGQSTTTTTNQSPSKCTTFVETPILWERSNTHVHVPEAVHASFVDPGQVTPAYISEKVCSKILRIMYRDESVKLHDVFEQRVLLQVDPTRLEESILKYDIFLCVELWFAEEVSDGTFMLHMLEKVHERQLRVHLIPTRSLHYHFNVFFDYFHLCAVEVAVHGALTSLSPSIISYPKMSPGTTPLPLSSSMQNLAQQSWHTILFAIRNHTSRVQLAHRIHRYLCHALLSARESMLLFWREMLPYLPAHQRPRIGTTNFAVKLEELTKNLHALNTDEEVTNQLSFDIAHLSSQNTVLLKQLCKSVVFQHKPNAYLRRKTHQVRMKRFAEAFFCQELSLVHLLEIYDPNTVGHESLANEVRQSTYFQQLPSLPISCRELDGDANTLPIIFEDVFLSPNVGDAKRASWHQHLGASVHERGSFRDVSREEFNAPRSPSHAESLIQGDTLNKSSEPCCIPMLNNDEVLVSEDTTDKTVHPSKDPTQHINHLPHHEMPVPLTVSSRKVSKSSPTLSDFGLPRAAVTLPPVLRYIGQNRRRFRRFSYHGRRSLQAVRSKHHLSSIPDPINDSPVRLLGYRSIGVMAAEVPDNLSEPKSESTVPVTRRGTFGIEQPVVRLRQKRMSIATRDLRSRSMSSLHTNVASSAVPLNDSAVLSHRSELLSTRACKSYILGPSSLSAFQTVTQRRAFSAEPLLSVLSTRFSYHNEPQSRNSGTAFTWNAVTATRTPGVDLRQSILHSNRSASPPAILSQSIALGTLSRPPLEPPGGCVPPAYLTNGLNLLSTHEETNTESSMHAFLRSRTLSNLSVPHLAYACSLARVKSESMLNSDSFAQRKDSFNYLSNNSGVRRKHSSTHSRRSNSSTCRTYTSDLACLSSYPELELTILKGTTIQRYISPQRPAAHMDANGKLIDSRLSHSASNLFALDSSDSYLHAPTHDYVPIGPREADSNKIRNGNNQERKSRSIAFIETSSNTNSNETIGKVDCSAKFKTLPLSTLETVENSRTHSNTVRSSAELPNGFHSLKTGNVNSLIKTCCVTSDDSSSRPIHHPHSRLSECGYEVQSDLDDSDDERTVKGHHGKHRSQKCTEEKMNILELLRADSSTRGRQDHSQHSRSTLNDATPYEVKHNSTKYRTLDSCSRPVSINCTRENSMLTLHPSCATLQAQQDLQPLVDVISPGVMEFLQLKENIKRQLAVDFQGHVYSDFATVAAPYAYFSDPPIINEQLHLIVCVHGLDGNASDLRLVRIYLQLALPDCRLEFLMSECNQHDTFAGFDAMRDNLVDEVISFIEDLNEPPARISFIAHSMGCVLVRAALCSPQLKPHLSKLHTFLSLSGPHLGTVYNSSGLVNMGMWVMQKWKKSESLSQLRLRDDPDLRNTYMYQLSASAGLDLFRYVLLVSSPQDRYVPYHSTRIELCKAAVRDNSTLGVVYMEMVTNILQRLIKSPRTTVVRYDIHYSLGSSANNLIGRAAHIAVLDSEVFLEKFICVSCAKYFR